MAEVEVEDIDPPETRPQAASDLEALKSEFSRLRGLARRASPAELLHWNSEEKVRFCNELRWCIDALRELDARVKSELHRR